MGDELGGADDGIEAITSALGLVSHGRSRAQRDRVGLALVLVYTSWCEMQGRARVAEREQAQLDPTRSHHFLRARPPHCC
jgi:hypothetical protein